MTLAPWTRPVACSALVAALLVGCGAEDPDSARDGAGAAETSTTLCEDRMGAVEVAGDLLVPEGSTCRLEGTDVAGLVTVSSGSSLVTTDARFGGGIDARGFDTVVLRGGLAEGRERGWRYDTPDAESREVDLVLEGGRRVVIEDGPVNGSYYLRDNTGQVRVKGLYLDLGSVHCSGNTRRPDVSRISAETPAVLSGQCAGLKNFGQTDF